MKNLVLHQTTQNQLDQLAKDPSHSYLFYGPEGLGKTTLAQVYAEKVIAGTRGDSYKWLYQISLLPDKKKISIAQVKKVLEFLSQKKPNNIAKKVVIIDEAQTLSIEAANALLKVLEEPPLDSLIILISSNAQSLPTTIRSRLAQIEFRPPNRQDVHTYFAGQTNAGQVLELTNHRPAHIQRMLDDQVLQKRMVELWKQTKEFSSQSLAEKLAIIQPIAKEGQTEEFINMLGQLPTSTNVARALLFAQRHLYNSGNPRFVLEHLALELS